MLFVIASLQRHPFGETVPAIRGIGVVDRYSRYTEVHDFNFGIFAYNVVTVSVSLQNVIKRNAISRLH